MYLKLLLVCVLVAWLPLSAIAQDEFVSGTVVELSPGRIVINRAVLGKPPEHRMFLITRDTKIEGRLRTNARVTIGFRPSEEGDIAIRIIVRS